jgi:hypothetical protein
VDVVIVTYNSAQTIADCLAALDTNGLPGGVTVVDNASSDGTAALVAERFPGTKLIANPVNEGFARGANRGLRETRSEFALLLNPDAEVRPDAIRALLTFAERRPRAALIGPRLLNPDGSLQHSCFRFPNLRMVLTGFFGLLPLDSPANGRYRLEEYAQPHQVEHLLGACLLIRRAAAEQVGLLDEGYYMYFEETDWCYRTHQAGWENWYCPDATVIHHGAHSTSREPERMSAEFHRSQARFYRKHYRPSLFLALKALSWAGVALWAARSTLAVLRGRISTEMFRRRLASYWSIVRA